MIQIAKLFGFTQGIRQKKNFDSTHHGVEVMKQNVFWCSIAPPFGQLGSFLLPGEMHTNYTYPPSLVSLGLTVCSPQHVFQEKKNNNNNKKKKNPSKNNRVLRTACLNPNKKKKKNPSKNNRVLRAACLDPNKKKKNQSKNNRISCT